METIKTKENTFSYKLLMLTTFIISGCSMCYELIISAVSSYLIGDSIKQFSITIGLYMCAMGLGSYLSKYIKQHLFDWFVFVELGVGVLGGISSLILFLANATLDSYALIMYIEILLIGTLVGIEIPLLTRIIEENAQNLRVTLSMIFSFDYIGGLIGSLAFPLLLLPTLGYFSTAFLVGLLNIFVAILIIFAYATYLKQEAVWKLVASACLILMLFGMLYSETMANQIEGSLYRDHVILNKQTKYQKIVVTKHKDDLRLFINGNIQFSSSDEYRYHESLVHIPMAAAHSHSNVLILGGGDGLAVRELLKYDDVTSITLIDLDDEMLSLCKTNNHITAINENALRNPKVTTYALDAYKYLETCNKHYDVIIVDLPDPNNESLNKLYTNLFYRLCRNALTENGVMSVQSTSPYYAKKAFWCVHKTIQAEGLYVIPYHVQVPSFGDWGFQLASKEPIDCSTLSILVPTKFLSNENLSGLFLFAKDEQTNVSELQVNTLLHPKLLEYYIESENDWY